MTTAFETIRWGQGPFAFELIAHDRALAERARAVFRPWLLTGGPERTARFEIEPAANPGDGARWLVRSTLLAEPTERGSVDEALRWVELKALETFVPATDHAIAVHGALTDLAGRGVLVVGATESGKSSLACGLWLEGAALLADDVALVELASDIARPGPRRVALRHASRALWGDALWERIAGAPSAAPTDEGVCFHPDDLGSGTRPASTPLACVIFLRRNGRPAGEPAALTRIEPAHAVLAWLPFLVFGARLDAGEAIRRVAPFAARVPAFDLERGPLAAMVAQARRAAGLET